MQDEKEFKVVHSLTKSAWNVVGTVPGSTYKIARVPYHFCGDEKLNQRERSDAYDRAKFIALSLNNKDFVTACISNHDLVKATIFNNKE